MREILFRGKPKMADNQDFVYGTYYKDIYRRVFILTDSDVGAIYTQVDEKTVGQYIGIDDCDGVKIFEGDRMHYDDDGGFEVVWYEEDLCFKGDCQEDITEDCKTIGTIHD